MSLNKIERFIFYNFVRNHIRQKKPIGSKFLAKKIKNFSAPTLRFYFQRLVKEGYLQNAKDFLGREPTEKGWRYYFENYKLTPEIKINFKNSLEEFLGQTAFVTENICFFRAKNSSKFIFKGLKKVLISFDDKKFLYDIGVIIENLEKIINKFDDTILIGKEIKESTSGCISLFIKKTKDFEIGFLGHKINFYHTICFILQQLNGK